MKFIIGALVVVVITVLLLEFFMTSDGGGDNTAMLQIDNIERALNLFRETVGRYPTEEEGLQALVKDPGIDGWNGSYFAKGSVPEDPWGQEYRYRVVGMNSIDIISAGRDGLFGNEDDISLKESQTEETY